MKNKIKVTRKTTDRSSRVPCCGFFLVLSDINTPDSLMLVIVQPQSVSCLLLHAATAAINTKEYLYILYSISYI